MIASKFEDLVVPCWLYKFFKKKKSARSEFADRCFFSSFFASFLAGLPCFVFLSVVVGRVVFYGWFSLADAWDSFSVIYFCLQV